MRLLIRTDEPRNEPRLMLTDERISISVNDSRAATDSAAILSPFQVE